MRDLSRAVVIRELLASVDAVRANPLLVFIAAVIDAVFFFAWVFVTTFISDSLIAHAVLISNKLSPLLAQKKTGLLKYLFEPDISPLTEKFIVLFALFFIVSYALYVIFQAASWWLANSVAGQKQSFRKYFLGFARINLTWFAGYAVFKILDILAGLRYVVIKRFAPDAPDLAGSFLLVLFVFLFIAAWLSYPTFKRKTFFKAPVSVTAPLLFLSLCLFLVGQFIVDNLGNLFLLPNLNKVLYYLVLFVLGMLLFSVVVFIKIYNSRVIAHVRSQH